MKQAVVALLFAAACGGSTHPEAPDAASAADAMSTPDAPQAAACDWTRADHTMLPDNETGPAWAGKALTLCGTVENLPASDQDPGFADDLYLTISSATDADVLVHFESAQPLDAFPFVSMLHWLDANQTEFDGAAVWKQHEAVLTHLSAGDNVFEIYAGTPTGTASAVTWRARIEPIDRATLCPAVTAAADYTEAHDGSDNHGNDVITFNQSDGTLVATASTTDAPEATGLTIADPPRRIHGNAANLPLDANGMKDADTYEITTGAATNELVVRNAFGGTGNNMRTWLLSEDLTTYQQSGPPKRGTPDLTIFTVDPGTKYYLWLIESPSSTGWPTDYDLSICSHARPTP